MFYLGGILSWQVNYDAKLIPYWLWIIKRSSGLKFPFNTGNADETSIDAQLPKHTKRDDILHREYNLTVAKRIPKSFYLNILTTQ